jgi:hypothetical protein
LANYTGSKGGGSTPSGWISIIRVLKVLKNHTVSNLTFAGSYIGRKGANAISTTKAGVLSLSGYVIKRIAKTKTGVLSLSGATTKLLKSLKTYSGALSSSGLIRRAINNLTRTYSGSSTLAGAITRSINNLTRAYSGALSSAGSIIYRLNYIIRSNLPPYGAYSRLIAITRRLSVALSSSGSLSRVMSNITKTYSGAVSMVGELLAYVNTLVKGGALSFSGAVTKGYGILSRVYAGVLSSAGAVTRIVERWRTKAGTISFAGTVRSYREYIRTYAGSISLAGILNYVNYRILKEGVLTLSGIVTNTSRRVRRLTFTGYVSVIRVVKYLPNHTFSILSFVGTVVGYVGSSLPLSGFASSIGTLTRTITNLTRSLSGTLSSVGTIIGQKSGYASHSETRDGILGLAGTIYEVWVVTPYTYVKNRIVSFAGAVTKGALKRVKEKSGVLTFTKDLGWSLGGYIHVQYFRTYAGALSFAGKVLKGLSPIRSGVQTLVGAITRKITVTHTYDGAIDFSGTIYGWLSGTIHFLYGYPASVLTFAGEVIRTGVVTQLYSGILSFTGRVTRLFVIYRAKESSVSFRGRAYGDKITDALYYGSPYGGPSYP